MRRRFSILIWFTSEGVMLKRIIWILFLLGLTWGCELFAHDGTVNISGSFRRNTCVLAVTGSFKPSGLFPPALQK